MSILQKGNLKILGGIVLSVIIIYSLFGKNSAGYYHVVQKWPSGELKIVIEPGLYWKGIFGLFSDVTELKVSGAVVFEDRVEKLRKEEKKIVDSINVIFKDNGAANINGLVRYVLPSDADKMRLLIRESQNEDILQNKILRNYINTVMTLVATSYSSTDS
ncbi:MAG: SPFH domain-containing protein, partial [Nitrospinota bacterium]